MDWEDRGARLVVERSWDVDWGSCPNNVALLVDANDVDDGAIECAARNDRKSSSPARLDVFEIGCDVDGDGLEDGGDVAPDCCCAI